ncbi:MAG: Crp/Fnr family transcriptional regulator [Bacteroidales bacterium]|nr:Crp/Fnr family transcriptional regulator [Bacteroidales bacterium]
MFAFKSFIEKYTPVSESDWELIENVFERKECKKHEFILEEDQICRHFWFLESGLIRFFYHVDGEDITKTFTIAPFVFTSRISFRKQEPANEGIQVLEDAIIWQCSKEGYLRLEKLNSWNIFMRKILNEIQEFSEVFYKEAKTMTAEARYRKLLQDYPADLIQKIPLKHISSLLGVAPQSLSRIRKKVHKPKKT